MNELIVAGDQSFGMAGATISIPGTTANRGRPANCQDGYRHSESHSTTCR